MRGESFNTLNHASPNGFGSTNITGGSLFGAIHHLPRAAQDSARFEDHILAISATLRNSWHLRFRNVNVRMSPFLDVTGRLIVGSASGALRERIQQAIAAGKCKLILNLSGVDYIDSTGLGTMVMCFRFAQTGGGALKLLNLNRRELELLVLTKLTTVFDIYNDEQDALNRLLSRPGNQEVRHPELHQADARRRHVAKSTLS